MANRRLASHHAEALIPAPGGQPQALGCRSGGEWGGATRPSLGTSRAAGEVCGCGLRKAWRLNQVSICRPGVNYVSPSQSLPPGAGVKDGPGGVNAPSDCSWRDEQPCRPGKQTGGLLFLGADGGGCWGRAATRRRWCGGEVPGLWRRPPVLVNKAGEWGAVS